MPECHLLIFITFIIKIIFFLNYKKKMVRRVPILMTVAFCDFPKNLTLLNLKRISFYHV